jgi:hypothetical protein
LQVLWQVLLWSEFVVFCFLGFFQFWRFSLNSSQSQSGFDLMEQILGFVDQSSGLRSNFLDNEQKLSVEQSVDGKVFQFQIQDLQEVLNRFDGDGKAFVQLNFSSGLKVLLTDTLVGFKPKQVLGLDMAKLPKVVTTPDLVSVFEAIEDNLSSDGVADGEVEILKRVYQSILMGAELAGFDLSEERNWLGRLAPLKLRASA